MIVQHYLSHAIMQLKAAGVHSPETDAALLLSHVAGISRVDQKLYPHRTLSPEQYHALNHALERRKQREPLQLILGNTEFYGLTLAVQKGILIPRPETEMLVYQALPHIPNHAKVLDMGCGTGAIALALKHQNPSLKVTASDIDPLAVDLTKENAQRLNLDITVLHSNLFENITEKFDVMVSNPPYLPEQDAVHAFPELKYENPRALYSGEHGLDFTRSFLWQAPKFLSSVGQVFLELDPRNVEHVALAGYQPHIFADLTGTMRFVHFIPNLPECL